MDKETILGIINQDGYLSKLRIWNDDKAKKNVLALISEGKVKEIPFGLHMRYVLAQ